MNMNPPEEKKQLNSYLKFSGIGFQMAATIILFAFLGHWLDGKFETEKPYITLLLMLVGVILSILVLIKQLRN